jgi:hypothetical protein
VTSMSTFLHGNVSIDGCWRLSKSADMYVFAVRDYKERTIKTNGKLTEVASMFPLCAWGAVDWMLMNFTQLGVLA